MNALSYGGRLFRSQNRENAAPIWCRVYLCLFGYGELYDSHLDQTYKNQETA